MILIGIGDVLVLTLHMLIFDICREAGVHSWWLVLPPIVITLVIWMIGTKAMTDDGEDVETALLSGLILALLMPGMALGCVLDESPGDLRGASMFSGLLACSALSIVVFYLSVLFIPYPEGTTTISSVLVGFIALGFQLAPVAGYFAEAGPDVPQVYEMAAFSTHRTGGIEDSTN